MRSGYERTLPFSVAKLGELRGLLDSLDLDNPIVLTCGSYARREASESSDIDYFVLTAGKSDDTLASVRRALSTAVRRGPSSDGAFGLSVHPDKMLANIGGQHDDNAKITQRVLLLLEGDWLHNETGLLAFRTQMLDRYIREDMADHQLTLFLLNDIIRYYRTIAVDYEYKTKEGQKAWAIRNVKLVFSRKFLYASGLFSVAMTADRTRDDKIRILEDLFAQPVVERMCSICGEVALSRVMSSYNVFLDRMSDPDVRAHLERLDPEERDDVTFRQIKNESYRFTRELLRLFEDTFDKTHPIRRAVVF